MKSRHVFSAPDFAIARAAIRAARQAGIRDEDISLIARSDIEIECIPDKRKNVSTDFVPAALRGALAGGVVGLVIGLIVMAIPSLHVTLLGASLIAFVSAMMGAWSSALIGSSIPDPVRRMFEKEIENGQILIVIDGEASILPRAEAAISNAGATLLPFNTPTALT